MPSGVFCDHPTLSFETESLSELELTKSARLASPQTPGIHYSLRAQPWDYRHAPNSSLVCGCWGSEPRSTRLQSKHLLTEPSLQPSTHFLSDSMSSQFFNVTPFSRPLYFPLDGYCVGTVLHPAVFILQKSIDHLCTSVYGKYRRFKAEIYQCCKAILRRTVYSCYVCRSLRKDRQGHQVSWHCSDLQLSATFY